MKLDAATLKGVAPWLVAVALALLLLLTGEYRRSRAADDLSALQSEKAIAERKVLASEQIASARLVAIEDLERQLAEKAEASESLTRQLDRLRRAAPRSQVESVITHTGDVFGVPIVGRGDTETSGDATGNNEAGDESAGVPLLQVSTTEARLKTNTGNVAVIGETVVRCVGGTCPLGWTHSDDWSVDVTHLIQSAPAKLFMRGWGAGLGVLCTRSGCGAGPALGIPPRVWHVRRREVRLDVTAAVSVAGERSGSAIALLRF